MPTAVVGLMIAVGALTACEKDGGASDANEPAVITGEEGQEEQERMFLSDLVAIEPALEPYKAEAMDIAQEICVDVRLGQSDDTVTAKAVQRFHTTPEKAGRIVESMRTSFCG
ncbi:hypothetical protein [Streptomyces sannanensis]|uniref:hypothetical protein n=1 Tax=Streptomyces sannanensis TaxID=285536 RepID=UPI0031EF5D95